MEELVGSALEAIFQFTAKIGIPSYALAIIIISVIVRVILMPLNVKQIESTVMMQQIQPQMKKLKEKYGSNPEKLNQKTMELYQEYNINPLAGCLPTLIQLPIMIGLYSGLRSFVPENMEYYSFFWVDNIGEVDTTRILFILVVLFSFLQSKIVIGKATDTMQKSMLYTMPLMMGYIAWSFPAFICLYMLTVSIFSIFQQVVVMKPLKAKFEAQSATAEAERKAKMQERKKSKSNKKKSAPNQAENANTAKNANSKAKTSTAKSTEKSSNNEEKSTDKKEEVKAEAKTEVKSEVKSEAKADEKANDAADAK